MKGRAFVSGVLSPQAVKAPLQSPAKSSLAEAESKGKPTITATAMTTYRVSG